MKSLRSYNELVLSRSGAFNTIDPNSESDNTINAGADLLTVHIYIYILTFHNVYQVDELACHAAQIFVPPR